MGPFSTAGRQNDAKPVPSPGRDAGWPEGFDGETSIAYQYHSNCTGPPGVRRRGHVPCSQRMGKGWQWRPLEAADHALCDFTCFWRCLERRTGLVHGDRLPSSTRGEENRHQPLAANGTPPPDAARGEGRREPSQHHQAKPYCGLGKGLSVILCLLGVWCSFAAATPHGTCVQAGRRTTCTCY